LIFGNCIKLPKEFLKPWDVIKLILGVLIIYKPVAGGLTESKYF